MIIIFSMNTRALIQKYFPDPVAFSIVYEHSSLVAAMAVSIAWKLDEPVDIYFIEQAAMLHDIGICMTAAPKIQCFGEYPYITHGIHGRTILEAEGLPRHALVCERHIGVGLTVEDIETQNLPLPHRDMSPTCIEEEIICFADLFYSKKPGHPAVEKSSEQVRIKLASFGHHKEHIFDRWMTSFGF